MSDADTIALGDTKIVEASANRRPPRAGMGRPAGIPNKTTRLLKEAILEAAENVDERGLVGYLERQAVENPGPFMGLLSKVLPMQVDSNMQGHFSIRWVAKDESSPE